MSTAPRTASLLIELGTEDLPMQAVATLAEHMMQSVEVDLIVDGFKDEDEDDSEWFATPRRLAFRIKDLPTALPEKDVERKGPTLEAALDADGVPNAAGLGFAKSCGVEFEALEHREGRLYFQGRIAGASLANKLEHYLNNAFASAPMSKRMRWGDEPYEFIRPLRWLLALHGEELLEIEVMGVQAGKISHGHRAYCQDPIAIASAEGNVYENTLKEKGKVIVSLRQRTEMIVKQFIEWGSKPGTAHKKDGMQEGNSLWVEIANSYDSPFQEATLVILLISNIRDIEFPDIHDTDKALFSFAQERATMTEWPDFVVGQIDVAGFETLPLAFLIQALMKNQHLLLRSDINGNTSKEFLAVIDLDTSCADDATIRHGLERIACARIADAVFFFNKDIEAGLEPLQENLHKVTFHRALGSLKDKSQRLAQLSQLIAEMMRNQDSRFNIDEGALQKAASLCKLDLLSDSVKEYPALQGEIGWHLISEDDTFKKDFLEDPPAGGASVADIVAQHYMPRPGSSFLPSTREGCILALADRIDILTGIFGIGERPTGSKDPYALRRASIAVIQLILRLGGRDDASMFSPFNCDFLSYPKMDVFALIDASADIYQQQTAPFTDEAIQTTKDYFTERLKHYYLSDIQLRGPFSIDCIEAAVAVHPGDVTDLDTRIHAIHNLHTYHEGKMTALVATNKRIKNILRKNKASIQEQIAIQEDMLEEGAERELYERLQSYERGTKNLIERKYYGTEPGLIRLIDLMYDELVQPLDDFFDKVMVMADDPIQRQNRLLLLQQVQNLFMQVGDLSKLQLPGEADDNS